MKVRRALVVAAGASLAACSLLTSLDGYSGGAPLPSTTTDAAAPDVLTPPPPPGDAGTDGSFCATSRPSATFCLDFEGRGIAEADRRSAQNGTYVVDAMTSTSPPNALLVSVTPTAAAEAFANVGHTDPRTVSDVVIEYAILTEQAGAKDIEIVHYAFGGWTVGMGLYADGTLYVYEYASAGAYAMPYKGTPRTAGTWTRVRFHLAAGTGKIDLDLDGMRVATGLTVSPPSATATAAELDVGIPFAVNAGNGNAWTVRFDDIVYDAK